MKLSPNARQQAEMLEETLHDTLDARRRSFLGKGALAVIAAASLPIIGSTLTSCSDDNTTTPTDTTRQRDIDMLNNVYRLEKLAVNTYAFAATALSGAYLSVGQSFLQDHMGHAGTFKDVLSSEFGMAAPADPASTENLTTGMTVNGQLVFKITPSIALADPIAIFRYALGVELTAAQMYVEGATSSDATKRLTNAKAQAAMADIAPVEAEHAAIFRAALKLLEKVPTDADAGSNVGRSIQPTSRLSSEMPKP